MTDVAEYLMKFFAELERLVPNRGTRHMISTTEDGRLEIRIGAGDRYRISMGAIDHADPMEAARSVAPGRRRIGKTIWRNKESKDKRSTDLQNLVSCFDVHGGPSFWTGGRSC